MFENFSNKCTEIYGLDPVYFVSAPGLAWQSCLKKTEVKLDLLIDYDMIFMIKKGIRGLGVDVKQYIGMLKQIINIRKIMKKAMNHHI